jgi:hypothetical protein
MTTTRWFACCDLWSDERACYVCGGPGVDTRTDGRITTARSWRNPASWVAEMEDA